MSQATAMKKKAPYTARADCRSCGGPLSPVFSLGEHALPDFGITDPESWRYAPLDIVQCESCLLIQLGHTVDRDSLFSRYWYRSGISETMRAALNDVADGAIIYGRIAKDDVVVDIGANDGTLLGMFPDDARRIAFEPSSIDPRENAPGCVPVRGYFSADAYSKVEPETLAKAVTSIAMFYSVEEPARFVADVARILHPSGVWVLQMNDLLALYDNNSFDIIGHEHVAVWSLHALSDLLKKHGLQVFRVERNKVNGGSIRCYIQHSNGGWRPQLNVYEQLMAENEVRPSLLAKHVNWAAEGLRELLIDLKRDGKRVMGYGASTRGCTILQAADIDFDLLECVADRDPSKHGFLMPGTQIPIVSEEQMREEKPDYLLALPYSYMKQFKEREADFIKRGGAFIVPLPEARVL